MTRKNWNKDWKFTKDKVTVKEGASVLETAEWIDINIPHTWNGDDGQDGGNDYYRGTCYYTKALPKTDLENHGDYDEVYLEFEGTNSSATLYINGKEIASHDGGYSTWRVNITEYLQDENEIVVAVDNAPNDYVYPQTADFTFYGGIYRSDNICRVKKVHFDMDYFGGRGVMVTPEIKGSNAEVKVNTYLTDTTGDETLNFVIYDMGNVVAKAENTATNPLLILKKDLS